jgi:hypothetical protein
VVIALGLTKRITGMITRISMMMKGRMTMTTNDKPIMLKFTCPVCKGNNLGTWDIVVSRATLSVWRHNAVNIEIDIDDDEYMDGHYTCLDCDFEFNGSAEEMRDRGYLTEVVCTT